MAIQIKTDEEIAKLREGGQKVARILRELREFIEPGVTTDAIDKRAFELAAEDGDRPAFLHYQPSGAPRGFPGSVCVSINDEIVHGIPNEQPRPVKSGDLVKLDFGLVRDGLVTDSATTVAVGEISDEAKQLMQATSDALDAGVSAVTPHGYTGDVGEAVESVVAERPFYLVKGLAGHGVGYEVHEDPFLPNEGKAGAGEQFQPGMVIAIEPMLSTGSTDVSVDDDGFTIRTADGSLSAHEEHTVAITPEGPETLTKE